MWGRWGMCVCVIAWVLPYCSHECVCVHAFFGWISIHDTYVCGWHTTVCMLFFSFIVCSQRNTLSSQRDRWIHNERSIDLCIAKFLPVNRIVAFAMDVYNIHMYMFVTYADEIMKRRSFNEKRCGYIAWHWKLP